MSVVKLSKPVTAHDEQISELTLREPTTGDIIDIGMPTLIILGDGGETGVEIRQKVVAKYISKLSGTPMSSVRDLSPKDFSACQAVVMGFFGEGGSEKKDSSATPSST